MRKSIKFKKEKEKFEANLLTIRRMISLYSEKTVVTALLFKLKEIRKALVYSLKREDIIKEINNSFSELIDLPFIYSEIKYKYDIYGAENELLSNGWKKENGIYTKNIEESPTLILKDIIRAKIIIIGALTKIRIII